MTFLDVLLLSIVEGLTEFLPVSSTAHLYLFEGLLKIQRTPFLEVFTILIQVGALFGTLFYIYKKERKFLVSYKNIIFGVLPTLVIGFLLYKIIKKYFAFNFELIAWALLIGGVIMIIVESWYLKQKNYKQEVTLKNSFVLGVIQSLAVIPGVSRSGAVLVGGFLNKIEKQVITGFSFSIGLPVVYFASIYDTYKTNIVFQSIEIFYLILGIILSGIFSYFSTKWIFKISKNISLKYFGIYRIILALIIFLVIFKI
jgi:undecaprenyl-diphosphatase